MGGYRVALETADPLAVDESVCRRQRFRQRLFGHVVITAVTFGLWLPGMAVWLALAPRWLRRVAGGYAVRIRGGLLVAGNGDESRTIPLDAIADVGVQHGLVTVSVRGAQAVQLFGLRAPLEAAQAILAAREAHLRGLRPDTREDVLAGEPAGGAALSRAGR